MSDPDTMCDHAWPKTEDYVVIRREGTKTLYNCNKCLTTKIVFVRFQEDGTVKAIETIIETPSKSQAPRDRLDDRF